MGIVDAYGRTLRYLRMAVTIRCNLRCVYCRPQGEVTLPEGPQLGYEEMVRVAEVGVGLGVECVRVTGGEPLLWPELERLVKGLRRVGGLHEVAITTNGQVLEDFAGVLARAGVTRVNISLDTLKPARYRAICGGELEATLRGVESALGAGFCSVKINMVVLRGINDDEVADFVGLTRDHPLSVRFIELMPLGRNGEFFEKHFVPMAEVKEKICGEKELWRICELNGHGPARSYAVSGHRGTIGFIAQVSEPRCRECNKLRIGADGMVSACLFSRERISLRPALERGDSDAMRRILTEGFLNRAIPDSRQTSLAAEATMGMYQIGG